MSLGMGELRGQVSHEYELMLDNFVMTIILGVCSNRDGYGKTHHYNLTITDATTVGPGSGGRTSTVVPL